MKVNIMAMRPNRVASNEIDNRLGIIKDGANNDLPLYVSNIIASSPTCSACVSTLVQAVVGRGVGDLENNIQVSNSTKLIGLIREIARDLVLYKRFAILCTPLIGNDRIQWKSLKVLPAYAIRYEVRDGRPTGRLKYNPYFGTSEESKRANETEVFEQYTTYKEKIIEDIAAKHKGKQRYKGVVYWYNEPSILGGAYSYPLEWSCLEAAKTEAELNITYYNSVVNQFAAKFALIVQGNENDVVELQDGTKTTLGESLKRELEEAYVGSENANSAMMYFAANVENAIKVLEFPTNKDMIASSVNLRNDITEQIVRAFRVPNILANIQTAGKLGASNEIQSAWSVLNANVVPMQSVLEEALNAILPHHLAAAGNSTYKIRPIII